MAFPADALTNPVTGDGQKINAAFWQANVVDPLNTLATFVGGDGSGITAAPGTGFSIFFTWEVANNVMWLTFTATRTGADLTFSSSGGLTDTTIATLTTSDLPSKLVAGNYVASTTSGGAALDTSGVLTIRDGHPTSTISTGDTVHVSLSYPIS